MQRARRAPKTSSIPTQFVGIDQVGLDYSNIQSKGLWASLPW